MDKNKTKLIPPILTFIGIIAGWELVDVLLGIKEIILPNPHEILNAIINNFTELMYHTSITGIEALLGFILGSLIAILIAVVFVYSKKVKKATYPYLVVLKAIPILALAPLLILWFGSGMTSKVVMAALIVFFPVLVNMFKGLSTIEQEELDLFKSLKATKKQVFWKLRLPHSLKYLFPALKIAITFAVVGATIAEFTGAAAGIGHLIVQASYYLETSLLFAGMVMISIVGIVLFYLVDYVEKKVVFWEKEN